MIALKAALIKKIRDREVRVAVIARDRAKAEKNLKPFEQVFS